MAIVWKSINDRLRLTSSLYYCISFFLLANLSLLHGCLRGEASVSNKTKLFPFLVEDLLFLTDRKFIEYNFATQELS